MTEPQPPRIIVPVGHDLGPRYDAEGANPAYQVRVGATVMNLEPSDYAVWMLCHGTAGRVEGWSREDVVAASRARGLTDPETIIDRLIGWTLLYDIALGTDESLDFSLLFRPVPLMLGLGTAIDDPDVYSVGTPAHAAVQTTEPIYDLYIWAQLDESLWTACEGAAAYARQNGALERERTDPRLLMEYFLLSAHGFLAVNALYFDVERELAVTKSYPMDAEGELI